VLPSPNINSGSYSAAGEVSLVRNTTRKTNKIPNQQSVVYSVLTSIQ